MRLQRGRPVAGVEPELARDLARACAYHWRHTEFVASRVHRPAEEVMPLLEQLAAAGFLESELKDFGDGDGSEPWWTTTLPGSALAMAKFLKPISRARADELLRGVLDRADTYNADATKPYTVTRIQVFGSYLREDVTELGDVDLNERKEWATGRAVADYARERGPAFSSYIDQVFWPQKELAMILKARRPHVSVQFADLAGITDDWRVVYPRQISR
ncbi:hypothetical protein [Georgenia yuyongxinii]